MTGSDENSLVSAYSIEAVVKCLEGIMLLIHFDALKFAQINSDFTTFHGWLGIGKLA